MILFQFLSSLVSCGYLAGSEDRARNSQSQGHELEAHAGCRDYLKILRKQRRKEGWTDGRTERREGGKVEGRVGGREEV